MRWRALLSCLVLISTGLFTVPLLAQQRYLISPNQEVIPLTKGESSASVVKKRTDRSQTISGTCVDKYTFGDVPGPWTNSNFGAYHKDVLGQWFVAKSSGTIDTIFWRNRASIGAYDSTIYIRVHTSVIGPDYGPGVRPGPFNPPCQNWGYWNNTNDLDMGIAAFVEEGTPPNNSSWVSTINGSPVPTEPPFSTERWGAGGFPIRIHPNTVHFVAMSELSDTIGVTIGDKFFISMRVHHPPTNGGHLHSEEPRTEWDASGFRVTTSDEDYPSRNWKFYEHDKGPSNCAGFPLDSIKRGWVARGGFGTDTLEVAAYNFWYVMTANSNVPPIIEDVEQLANTFSQSDRSVTATIIDCNLENPGNAGVASVDLRYVKNNDPAQTIPMNDLGGDLWQAEIPAALPGDHITYKVIATDFDGAVTESKPPITYRVSELQNLWYSVDTSYTCVKQDIRSSGTLIDTSRFFLPPTAPGNAQRRDDGTAGPYDMGGDFVFFGDTFRYAWIGVNGAIALTYSPTDTSDVNANGQASTSWDLPYGIVRHGRADTTNLNGMPRMFIAPFWADHIISADSPTTQFGRIVYGDNGNTCQFIVEWDSIGAFDPGGSVPDETTFRVILNRCNGVVEFQWDNVGTTGIDSFATVGLQYDTSGHKGKSDPYIFVNDDGYPIETKPRNNWCVKLYPAFGSAVSSDGWHLVSLPCIPADEGPNVVSTLSCAVSQAFKFVGGYVACDTMVPGRGYWLKSGGSCLFIPKCAQPLTSLTIDVQDRWNLIGSISCEVPAGSVVAGGGTSVASQYFSFGAGYVASTTIEAGLAYWVKVNGAGTLTLNCSQAPPKANAADQTDLTTLSRVTIQDATGAKQTLYLGAKAQVKEGVDYYEMPPVPPTEVFDVRYGSQRMLEVVPDALAKGAQVEYPIQIQSAKYPLTVRWDVKETGSSHQVELVDAATGGKMLRSGLDGTGKLVIKDPQVKTLVLKLTEGGNTPKVFALSQNYPNPFNPSTEIRYQIPAASMVSLRIMNVLGEEVALLVNEPKNPGEYSVQWDASDMPSGVYFATLSADGQRATKKMILLK